MFDLGPSFVPLPPELMDATVRLRPPRYVDFKAWRDVRESSRAFLEPWEPRWPADELERGGKPVLGRPRGDCERGPAEGVEGVRELEDPLADVRLVLRDWWSDEGQRRDGKQVEVVEREVCCLSVVLPAVGGLGGLHLGDG